MNSTSKKDNRNYRLFINIIVNVLVYFILIPLLIFLSTKTKRYYVISMIIACLCCVPHFVKFENSETNATELVIIATMTAISIVGRLIFASFPSFKPVTAIVIITGIAFGREAGFISGCMTALISNIFFGQGPWTVFQMYTWGIIGYISGILYKNLGDKKPNLVILAIIGAISGVVYSLLMDVFTTISMDKEFTIRRYLYFVGNSFSVMIIYVISNVIFLVVLARPILVKINRIKKKYGVFNKKRCKNI